MLHQPGWGRNWNFDPPQCLRLQPPVIADWMPRATRIFSLASVGHVTGHMVSHMVLHLPDASRHIGKFAPWTTLLRFSSVRENFEGHVGPRTHKNSKIAGPMSQLQVATVAANAIRTNYCQSTRTCKCLICQSTPSIASLGWRTCKFRRDRFSRSAQISLFSNFTQLGQLFLNNIFLNSMEVSNLATYLTLIRSLSHEPIFSLVWHATLEFQLTEEGDITE